MIKIHDCGIILESRNGVEYENSGVLNPACIEKDGVIHLFYRAVRKGNFSTIGYCQLIGNKVIFRADKPILIPEFDYESHGVEDPRITFLNGRYHLLYTAYDGKNALISYATSPDLKIWQKQGLISPKISYDEAEDIFNQSGISKKYIYFEKVFRQINGDSVFLWEKDAMLFPRKFNGKYALIHRVLPGIQICYFDDFSQLTPDFWRHYLKKLGDWRVLDPKYQFESSYIGGGCPPLETEVGWLLIYHTAEDTSEGQIYRAGAALLDKKDPQKVIGRLPYPLFSPEKEWERQGIINDVVFPTSAIIKNDTLSIYYGAADTRIALKTLSLSELLGELLKNSN